MDEFMTEKNNGQGAEHFSVNMQFLRKQKELSQEALAEKLNVSRQSVSKWESGTAFPEMSTLIAICDLFNIDMDTLMRGSAQRSTAADSVSYDKHMNKFAKGITAGVGLVFVGVAAMLVFEGFRLYYSWPTQLSAISTAFLLLFVIVAVVLFIVNGMHHDSFTKKNSNLSSLYTKAQSEAFNHKFVWLLAGPVAVILCSVIIFMVLQSLMQMSGLGLSYSVWIVAGFMLVIGSAVCVLTWAGIQKSKYEMEDFRHSQLPPKVRRIKNALDAGIMLAATAVYVVFGIVDKAWGTMWWVFVLGGFLCAIVSVVIENLYDKKES